MACCSEGYWEEEQPFPCDWQLDDGNPFFGEYCGVSPSRGVQAPNGVIFYYCDEHREIAREALKEKSH